VLLSVLLLGGAVGEGVNAGRVMVGARVGVGVGAEEDVAVPPQAERSTSSALIAIHVIEGPGCGQK